jgi:hypothetical protein
MARPPSPAQLTNEVAPTTTGLYRLYEQRWIGVFALASIPSLHGVKY